MVSTERRTVKSAGELTTVLKGLDRQDFCSAVLRDVLRGVQLFPDALTDYLQWRPQGYTRNLVYRDDIFELLVVCWEVGACSAVHDHGGQECWLAVCAGGLAVESFALQDHAQRGRAGEDIGVVCDGFFVAGSGGIDHRDAQRDLHRVANPSPQRAISVHVYACPVDTCIVYDTATGHACRQQLFYDTIAGKAVAGKAVAGKSCS